MHYDIYDFLGISVLHLPPLFSHQNHSANLRRIFLYAVASVASNVTAAPCSRHEAQWKMASKNQKLAFHTVVIGKRTETKPLAVWLYLIVWAIFQTGVPVVGHLTLNQCLKFQRINFRRLTSSK